MNILWLAWKDYAHPQQGGAELVLHELAKRQVAEGHRVTILTARYKDALPREDWQGIKIIRVGNNRYTHPLQALLYYLRHLRGKFDLIIETVNTLPYLTLLFRGKTRGVALYHQLARDIWFFETKAPISQLGYYVIEPLTTWLLGRAKAPLITVSESTRRDLARFGWDADRSYIISEGIQLTPVADPLRMRKYKQPTILSFGALRGMKRTLDQVKAFEIAKQHIPELQLKIAGGVSGPYGQRVLDYIQSSKYANDIEYLGYATAAQKIELMQRCHVITVTSIKEGWGLIVTEAASQGTPAVVYDVDGLRDSVRHEKTGLVAVPTPAALALCVVRMLTNKTLYRSMQLQGWEWSKSMTFEQSYQDFTQIITKEALS